MKWLKRIFDPQIRGKANQKPRILIYNGFNTHETLEILEYYFENNIFLCRLPFYTFYKLQLYDVGVFSPLKTTYCDEVKQLYRRGLNTIGKEHFTSLYKPTKRRALTKRNIKAGWAATGLFPFNPEGGVEIPRSLFLKVLLWTRRETLAYEVEYNIRRRHL